MDPTKCAEIVIVSAGPQNVVPQLSALALRPAVGPLINRDHELWRLLQELQHLGFCGFHLSSLSLLACSCVCLFIRFQRGVKRPPSWVRCSRRSAIWSRSESFSSMSRLAYSRRIMASPATRTGHSSAAGVNPRQAPTSVARPSLQEPPSQTHEPWCAKPGWRSGSHSHISARRRPSSRWHIRGPSRSRERRCTVGSGSF